jgi:hypothetical protein
MHKILIATSNPGKLRDFAGAAAAHAIEIAGIPNFSSLPTVVEDGLTFEANARKKAEEYSRAVPGEMVVADDSGLPTSRISPMRIPTTRPTTRVSCESCESFRRTDALEDLCACLPSLAMEQYWPYFAALPKERFSTRRGARTVSATIRYFIFRRFKRPSPN